MRTSSATTCMARREDHRPPGVWPSVRVQAADLLDAVEVGGVAAAIQWMAARGLTWGVPAPPGTADPGCLTLGRCRR